MSTSKHKAKPKRPAVAAFVLEQMGMVACNTGNVMIVAPAHIRRLAQLSESDISHAIAVATGGSGPAHPGEFCDGVVTPTANGDGVFPVYGAFAKGSRRPLFIVIDVDNDISRSGNAKLTLLKEQT